MKRIFTSLVYSIAFLAITGVPAGAQWSVVGGSGLSSSVANFTAMAVSSTGTPYIAYSDNSVGNKLSVEKYNGTSWVLVGSAGVSAGTADKISMTIDGSGNVYVGFTDGSVSGKATVMKYNGTSWSTVGSAGLSDGQAYYVSVAVNNSGTLYVAYQDQTVGGKTSVKRFTGSAWAYEGTKGFTSGQSDHLCLDIDNSGNLYIAYRDNNLGWKARVMRYNGSSWSTLGTAGFSAGGISDIDIAIDGNNRPYVVYKDWNASNAATVQSYTGSAWSVVGTAGFSAGGIGTPEIALDANNTPYVVYRDDANNQKATAMTFNGTAWVNVTTAGFSSNVVDYTTIAIDQNTNTIYVGFKDNAVSQKATVMKHAGAAPSANTWTGNTSTSWSTASNWSLNAVPTSADNIKVPGGRSRYPSITSGTASCKNIEIASGGSVIVNGGRLLITGDITNNGELDATNGTIEMNGSAAQTIPAGAFKNKTVRGFDMDNAAGCTLADTLKVTDVYYPTKGTLTTNNKLVLKSDATRTARIAQGSVNGGYFNGNVTVEKYIPGRRAFRFLAHPFGHSIPLSQLTDDIDITGQGGTSNGFAWVQVNSPSAFWFNQFTADNSTYGNNPGWKEFTSAYSSDWDQAEMARILIRGSIGQGLTGTTYYPDSVTLDMYGSVQQGDKLIGLDKGSNSYYVICGNPFASPINLNLISRTGIGSNFAVWDPYIGTRGGYSAYQFSSSYILPAYAGFVTTIASGYSKGFLNFSEYDKSSGTPAAVLKTTAQDFRVELTISDSATQWDRLLVDFDDAGMTVQDTMDMIKLNNPDVDFYTLSADNQALSIDVRPYQDSSTITLGFMPYMEQKFVLRAPEVTVPAGVKLYLYDKFTNQTKELVSGFEYWFDATSDTLSFGHDRFFINMTGKPGDTASSVTVVGGATDARMQLIPNPAYHTVKVSFDKVEGAAMVSLVDMTGKVLYRRAVAEGAGSVVIPVSDMPAGVYMVELQGSNARITGKLVKQ